jgi:hypothetical protein
MEGYDRTLLFCIYTYNAHKKGVTFEACQALPREYDQRD